MNENNKASSRTKPVELTHAEAVALLRALKLTNTDRMTDDEYKQHMSLIERFESLRF